MQALSILLFFVVFAATLGLKNIPNGFAKENSKHSVVEINVIDQEEADKLFREFVSHKEIPFRFPWDGCYARATAMAKIAEKKKIITGRVYATRRLVVKTDSAKYPEVMWGWHVAPIIYVRQEDGTDKKMVFDPSMFNKPVSVEEWTNRMKDTNSDGVTGRVDSVYYGSRFQYYPSSHEKNKTSWDWGADSKVKKVFDAYRAYEDLTAPISNSPQPAQQEVEGAR